MLMLTYLRYSAMLSFVSSMKAVKNDTEIYGMQRTYPRMTPLSSSFPPEDTRSPGKGRLPPHKIQEEA